MEQILYVESLQKFMEWRGSLRDVADLFFQREGFIEFVYRLLMRKHIAFKPNSAFLILFNFARQYLLAITIALFANEGCRVARALDWMGKVGYIRKANHQDNFICHYSSEFPRNIVKFHRHCLLNFETFAFFHLFKWVAAQACQEPFNNPS